jgi:hypothetical protein
MVKVGTGGGAHLLRCLGGKNWLLGPSILPLTDRSAAFGPLQCSAIVLHAVFLQSDITSGVGVRGQEDWQTRGLTDLPV